MEGIKAVNAVSGNSGVSGAAGAIADRQDGSVSGPDSYAKAEPRGNLWDSLCCAMARMRYDWQTGECTQYPNHVWNFRR